MDSKQILSVGIDIGTSTSQLVFSRLELRNRAAACQIPRFEITDRRIVWQSPVAFTPLTDVDTLDEAALDPLSGAGMRKRACDRKMWKRARSL